jgi:hypothetical protein
MDWVGMKNEVARLLFDKDALHIYFAVAIQVAVAAWDRRSLGDARPWLAVLGMEVINEVLDLARGGEHEVMAWQVVSAAHDFVNTMIMPTVLLLLVRYAPGLFAWHYTERALVEELKPSATRSR